MKRSSVVVWVGLIILAFTGLTGCVEDNDAYDGWDVQSDTGTDAGPDTSRDTSQDTSEDIEEDVPPDPTCSSVDEEESCQALSECRWAPVSCNPDGTPVMGCVDEGNVGAIDCRSCYDINTQELCASRPSCNWHQRVCDGEVLEEGCLPADVTPSPNCPDIDPATCPDRADCPSSACEELFPGCGPAPDGGIELEEPLCTPKTECTSDTMCPGDLKCAEVMVNPCHNSACGACGALAKRCVPPDMVPEEEDGCANLPPDRCDNRPECIAVWAPHCGDTEPPDGVVAYDDFKCLPRPKAVPTPDEQQCNPDGSSCPDNYECGEVWWGCPPDSLCSACASPMPACIPEGDL